MSHDSLPFLFTKVEKATQDESTLDRFRELANTELNEVFGADENAARIGAGCCTFAMGNNPDVLVEH